MPDQESRALGRALVVLFVASGARWGWNQVGEEVTPSASSVVVELAAEANEALSEAEARARPLEPGERLDLNSASEIELDRLPGVGPALARAIVADRAERAGYRSRSELADVRGIGPTLLARLEPLVDVTNAPTGRLSGRARTVPGRARAAAPERIDLNRAGAAELEGLPGIGPAISARIIAAREERLFTSVDSLVIIKGIGPATLARLRPWVTVTSSGR